MTVHGLIQTRSRNVRLCKFNSYSLSGGLATSSRILVGHCARNARHSRTLSVSVTVHATNTLQTLKRAEINLVLHGIYKNRVYGALWKRLSFKEVLVRHSAVYIVQQRTASIGLRT